MSSSPFAGWLSTLISGLLVSGCMFQDVRKQQEQLDASCLFSGSVSTTRAEPHNIVVILLRRAEGQAAVRNWEIVDHFESLEHLLTSGQ